MFLESGSLCTLAYSQNLILQCCVQLNLVHTTMDIGENSLEIPFFTGNAFIQRMKKYNRFTTINLCSQSNGRSLSTDLPLYFTFKMHLSIGIIMDLGIFSKLDATIMLPTQFGAHHHVSWGELLGDTVFDGERMHPKNEKV